MNTPTTYVPLRLRIGALTFWASLFLVGCATTRPVSTSRPTGNYNSYDEDLSAVRPSYAPTPAASAAKATTPAASRPPVARPAVVAKPAVSKPAALTEVSNVNRRLESILDSIAVQNRSVRYAPGYRIQVYVGNQRQEADAAKLLMTQSFPELSPYLSYTQPTYKLKVGDFMRRLDAERYYASVRQLIPSAQLHPDKVNVHRSLLIK